MPSKSLKQHKLMVAVSKDRDLAERLNIDQSVAREFVEKDKEAGLFQESSMESFDGATLEVEELKELIPSTEDIEANRGDVSQESEDGDEDDDKSTDRTDDDADEEASGEREEASEKEEYSEESHKEPEKPFRFEDRFKSQ